MCKNRHPGYPYSRKTDGNLRNLCSEMEYILHNVLIMHNSHRMSRKGGVECSGPSSANKAKRSAPVNEVSPESCVPEVYTIFISKFAYLNKTLLFFCPNILVLGR